MKKNLHNITLLSKTLTLIAFIAFIISAFYLGKNSIMGHHEVVYLPISQKNGSSNIKSDIIEMKDRLIEDGVNNIDDILVSTYYTDFSNEEVFISEPIRDYYREINTPQEFKIINAQDFTGEGSAFSILDSETNEVIYNSKVVYKNRSEIALGFSQNNDLLLLRGINQEIFPGDISYFNLYSIDIFSKQEYLIGKILCSELRHNTNTILTCNRSDFSSIDISNNDLEKKFNLDII